MLLLLERQILKDLAAALIARETRCARVEVETAALGGDSNAERIARKYEIGVPAFERRAASRTARFAGAVDLHDALRRGEVARRGHFLDEALDVGAEELERTVTGFADQMKVTR